MYVSLGINISSGSNTIDDIAFNLDRQNIYTALQNNNDNASNNKYKMIRNIGVIMTAASITLAGVGGALSIIGIIGAISSTLNSDAFFIPGSIMFAIGALCYTPGIIIGFYGSIKNNTSPKKQMLAGGLLSVASFASIIISPIIAYNMNWVEAYTGLGIGIATFVPSFILVLSGSVKDVSPKKQMLIGGLWSVGSLSTALIGAIIAGASSMSEQTSRAYMEIIGSSIIGVSTYIFISSITTLIIGGVRANLEKKEETYEYSSNIEINIREEDGAIGLSW